MKKIIQTVALFLMLIVLPAGSWYYLQSGFDYQKGARAQLLDYGKLEGDIVLDTDRKNNFTLDDCRGNLSLFSFVNHQDVTTERIDVWNRLFEQFEETNRAIFVLGELDTLVDFSNFTESKNCIYTDVSASKKILSQLSIPKIEEGRGEDGKFKIEPIVNMNEYPYYVLVDSTLTIRNYYRVGNEPDLKRLVEHLAIMVPREPSKKPVLIRDSEK